MLIITVTMVLSSAGNAYKATQVNRKVSLNLRVKKSQIWNGERFQKWQRDHLSISKTCLSFCISKERPLERFGIEICMWIEAHWKVLAFRYNGSPTESTMQDSWIPKAHFKCCQVTKGPAVSLWPAFIWWLINVSLRYAPKPYYYLKVSLLNCRKYIHSRGTKTYQNVLFVLLFKKKNSGGGGEWNEEEKIIMEDPVSKFDSLLLEIFMKICLWKLLVFVSQSFPHDFSEKCS